MSRASILTALAGALIAVVAIGGFLALDSMVLHIYSEGPEDPTPTPRPTREPSANFTESDVIRLTQQAVSQSTFPTGTNSLGCVSASFRSGNKMWVVTCEFTLNPDFPPPRCTTAFGQACPSNPEFRNSYLFDDTTGEVEQ